MSQPYPSLQSFLDGSCASGQTKGTFISFAETYGLARSDGTLPHPLTDEAQSAISSEAHSLMANGKSLARRETVITLLRDYQAEYVRAAEAYKPKLSTPRDHMGRDPLRETNEKEIPAPGTAEGVDFVRESFLKFSRDYDPVTAAKLAALDHYQCYEQQLEEWKEFAQAGIKPEKPMDQGGQSS